MILKIEYTVGTIEQAGNQQMVSFTVTLAADKDSEVMVIARGMALPGGIYSQGQNVMGWFDRLEKYKRTFDNHPEIEVTHVDFSQTKGYIEFNTTKRVPPEAPPKPSQN